MLQGLRNAHLFIILFVRSFLGGLLAILAGCSQFCLRPFFLEIPEEIHHIAGWEGGGGVMGHKNGEQKLCEQTGAS